RDALPICPAPGRRTGRRRTSHVPAAEWLALSSPYRFTVWLTVTRPDGPPLRDTPLLDGMLMTRLPLSVADPSCLLRPQRLAPHGILTHDPRARRQETATTTAGGAPWRSASGSAITSMKWWNIGPK